MVAPVAGVPGVNPVTAQIPNFVVQQLQTQRMQQLAAALSEQGQGPIDHDPHGRISWTQGLAKVLQGGLGAYLGNQGIQQQAGLTQQAMDAQGQAYGMGQPSPSQFALGQGAAQGSVGPTNDNAARLAAALSPAQKQGVSGSVMATPYNPQGLPPQLLMSADYGSPGATAQRDALLKNLELTDASKNDIWQGIPSDQAKAITLSDATNKGFHAFSPGEAWTNTLTGGGGFAPNLPANSQPNAPFTPGSPIPSVGAVPGAIPVAAQTAGATAGADAGARFPFQTQTVLDAGNNPTLATNGQVFPGVGGGGGVPRMPAAPAIPLGAPGAPVVQPGMPQQPAITRRTGLSATTTNLLGQGGDLLKTAQAAQQGNQQLYSYMDEMEGLLKSGAKFGPGTPQYAHALAVANNYVPGIDLTGAQTNQDVMHKLAASMAGATPARSDADLAQWQARNPGNDMTNAASLSLLPILRRTAQVQDARANVLTHASANGLEKLPDLANQFSQIASPGVVSDGRSLAQASQGGPQAVQAFVSQFKAAHPGDWQQRMKTIQQLDSWGAFNGSN